MLFNTENIPIMHLLPLSPFADKERETQRDIVICSSS